MSALERASTVEIVDELAARCTMNEGFVTSSLLNEDNFSASELADELKKRLNR